jgi:hypothetical protein
MKLLSLLFITYSVFHASLSAVEFGFISLEKDVLHPEAVTLNEGDIFEVLSNTGIAVGLLEETNDAPITTQNYRDLGFFSYNILTSSQFDAIVGPLKITFSSYSYSSTLPKAYIAYKITRASEVEYKNVNIVALPSATVGAGTHEIVVEASDDLQTWTPVHSSSISGNNAFFRTRVVETAN